VAHAAASASGSGTATTPAINTTGATLLIMMAADYAQASTSDTRSDSKGNTWIPLQNCAAGVNNVTAWYTLNPVTDSAHTFQVKGSYTSMAVLAFAGVSSFQSVACNISTGGTTLAAGPVTTTVPSLLVTVISHAMPGRTVTDGFAISDFQPYGSSEGIAAAYLIQQAAGTSNPVWTNNAGQNYSGLTLRFQ
jgi:hypothetical protein